MPILYYILLFALLLICEVGYIKLARKYLIGAKEEQRSSHKGYKLSGGGIIFIFSAIIYYIYSLITHTYILPSDFGIMIAGATTLAIISFIDDIRNLPPGIRLLIHFLVIGITFSSYLFSGHYDIFLLILICGIGFINAYNFMDGIDGIMAGYSIVTLGTLYYCYISIPGASDSFILSLLIASLIFSYFNFRKKSICFAGDVGSIVMGFFIAYLIVRLITYTLDATVLVFLIVYAVDTVYTIFQRLFAGENILLSHRHHLYQLMANQWHKPHYIISLGYALTQSVINVIYFMLPSSLHWTYFILVITLLSVVYFIIKLPALRHES